MSDRPQWKPFSVTVTRTYTPLWVHCPFTTYTDEFIRIRANYEYKCSECFRCGRAFKLGEEIALAAIKNVGNRTFCVDCAKLLECQ